MILPPATDVAVRVNDGVPEKPLDRLVVPNLTRKPSITVIVADVASETPPALPPFRFKVTVSPVLNEWPPAISKISSAPFTPVMETGSAVVTVCSASA